MRAERDAIDVSRIVGQLSHFVFITLRISRRSAYASFRTCFCAGGAATFATLHGDGLA